MDSRLLNVFHDDPFDGTYVEYEHDPSDLWSDETTRSLDLQLTETLNGILPLAPTDTVEEIYSGDGRDYVREHRKEDSLFHNNNNVDSKNALIFAERQFNGERRGRNEIQVIRIDPNVIEDSDDEDGHSDEDEALDGRLSQLSGATFRTRTDSSSIGDYESHSSDYDEDDDDEEENVSQEGGQYREEAVPAADNTASQLFANITNQLGDELTGIIASDDFLAMPTAGKSRTYSTNTICSDVDALGLHIDANTFDLAEFITKDDFTLPAPTTAAPTQPARPTASNSMAVAPASVRVNATQREDSDSDSDVIVDVETVDFDAEEEAELQKLKRSTATHLPLNFYEEQADEEEDDEVPFMDNVKKDPIWNPKQDKKAEATHKEQKTTSTTTTNKHTISKTTATTNINTTTSKMTTATTTQSALAAGPKAKKNNFSLIPSKKQSDLLKGKLAGKNKSTARAQKLPSKHPPNDKQPAAGANPTAYTRATATLPKIGVGQGGKNLSLIAQQLQQAELSSDDNATPKKEPPVEQTPPCTVKRKLNLEEYKQRRNGTVAGNGEASGRSEENEATRSSKVARLEGNPIRGEARTTPSKAESGAATTASKHSPAVTAIVKSLKENHSTPPVGPAGADPITVAKNKVLRMQQLKKQQQLKIIDSTISAKVPRVTKLLPLKEIVRDTCYYEAADEESRRLEDTLKSHPDYEEIIIVSASCNTEVSLPPHEPEPTTDPVAATAAGHKVNVSRSLLKSSTLLYNITNNLKTKKCSEAVPTNSLIASIQNVVVKQNSGPANAESKPTAGTNTEVTPGATNAAHHGEDKIIMHLRKDRIRRPTAEMGTQTDLHPDFPTLPLKLLAGGGDCFESGRKSRKRERRSQRRRCYRKRNGGHTTEEASSETDSSASDSDSYAVGRRSYRSRSPADGYASSAERLRLAGDANTNGGYSSRSSRRHRSSVSSSYSESDRLAAASATLQQRQRHGKLATSSQRARRYSSRSSSTSSMSDYSEGRSRSRTRSRSPYGRRSRSPPAGDSRRRNNNNYHKNNNVSQPAVEERRIVYVGRIEQETTKEMLRRKFLPYGNIKQITIHYKDTGMKYGFVTYDRSQDAFTVIDTGPRDPTINMYDISFGGRRAFCRATYADLDNAGINTYHSYVYPKIAPPPKEEDSFEALLLKVKAKMNATKPGSANNNNQPDETSKI